MDVFLGTVGLPLDLRRQLESRSVTVAERRNLRPNGAVHGDAASFFCFEGLRSVPCRRLHDDADSMFAWSGHVVHSRLELWPDAQRLKEFVVADPERSVKNLDGLYALALFDKSQEVLCLACDRYGFWPLYTLQTNGGLLFSNSVDLLLRLSPIRLHLNPQAVAEYLHFSYCLRNKTFVGEINRVPQGEILVYECGRGRITTRAYFDYSNLPTIEIDNTQSAIAELVPAFEGSLKRRRDDERHIVNLLSGGFDSRAICAGLARLGIPFETMTTYGDTGNADDSDAARIVAGVLGVKNTYIPLPSDYLEQYWHTKCLLTDFATTMHTWLLPLCLAHDAPGTLNFDGLGGDVVLKSLLVQKSDLDLLRQGGKDELVDAVCERHRMGSVLTTAVAEPFGRCWQSWMGESVARSLDALSGHPSTLSAFILRNRTRRAIVAALWGMIDLTSLNMAPFFDHDLFDIGMRIEPELKVGGRLYREFIAAIDSRLAGVPSSNDSTWPEITPRRQQQRFSISGPAPLGSYLKEIRDGMELAPKLIREGWLKEAEEALEAGADARWSVMRDSQALGELFFWFRTYRDEVSIDLA